MIQQAFVDMENMFDLMKEEQEVSDAVLIIIESQDQQCCVCLIARLLLSVGLHKIIDSGLITEC